jgi:hypothetical protein
LPKLAQFRRPPDAPLIEVDTSRVLLAFAEPQGSRKGWELVRCYDRATKRLGTTQHWDVAPESLLEPGERDTLKSVLQQGTAADARR